jgi:transposase
MEQRWGVAGGDAHKHTITFGVIDSTGGEIGVATFPIDPAGMVDLLEWFEQQDVEVRRVGIEGSASWGRAVTKFLTDAGFDVREVNPARTSDRRRRRRRQKTDREDAFATAREVLADPALPPAICGAPLSAAHAEIAVLCERRRSLIRRRQRALNEVEGLLTKIPLDIRAQLPSRKPILARLRALAEVNLGGQEPHVTELVSWLLEIFADVSEWEARVDEIERRLPSLLAACGSTLTEEVGIGVVSASELVATVGDPTRFPSEGAFARWCGVAPVAASSGEGADQPRRHHLDLLGNRTVNRILYVMSVTQARHDDLGKAFLARKRAEGKTKKEAHRAHKRQLANRVIRRMWADHRQIIKEREASTAAA